MDFNMINNDVEADEQLERISELQAEMKHIEETAQTRIEKINKWKSEQSAYLENKIDHKKEQLQLYFQKWREEHPGKKTLNLAYGKMQSKKQRDKWIYPKDADLISEIKNVLPDIVESKESINKNTLKAKLDVVNGNVIVKDTGEVLDCIKIEERGEKITIKAV